MELAFLKRDEPEANNLAAPRKVERQAKEKASSLQGKTTTSQPVLQPSILKWAMIGVIGFCILGAGVWGFSYLAGLEPGSPTQGPNTSLPAAEIPDTGSLSTATQPTQPVAPSEKIQIRWFVGLGTGVSDQQIPVEQEVVADFNASHSNIELVLNVIPSNDNPQATFSDQIASGNGPDIIGPVGLDGSNAFSGEWLDLAPYVSETSFNLVSDPALKTFFQSEVGQFGLPVGVYPASVYYLSLEFEM